MRSLKDCYMLSNGVKIPCIAYGTYKSPDGEECVQGVKCALENGYRHIDTAEFYGNEFSIGKALREIDIPRKEIFITSKVWNTHQGFRTTIEAFESSLDKLGLDYLDLYLIHWPNPKQFREDYPEKLYDTWNAMERLYRDGKVRAIGVCNCLTSHLKDILRYAPVKPMVLQNEIHIGYMQKEVTEFAQQNGIVVEAWAPLCRGKAFGTEPLSSIAYKYGKTEAQILVKWSLQHNLLPLPKSIKPERIIENADVFDFEISKEDMARLDAFDGLGRLGSHPDTAEF